MANEAVLKIKLGEPWDWIVENVTGVEKGTVMKMSGVGIAAIASGVGDVFAGITRREKIALDGRTRLSLFRRGVFDMKACPVDPVGISQGDWVKNSGTNLITVASEADVISGKGIGIAREDIAADGTGEIIVGGF